MKFNSLVTVFALVATVLFCAPTVQAQTIDNSAIIAQLMQQIAQLQAQLTALLAQQTTTGQWCYTFNNNMGYGASGADYNALIIVLDREGISEFTPDNKPIQYNEIIGAAIVKLQGKHGILQSGYVGPITRAKLNKLYGCSQPLPTPTTQPTLSVMANGSLDPITVPSGSPVKIVWTATEAGLKGCSIVEDPYNGSSGNVGASGSISMNVYTNTTVTVICTYYNPVGEIKKSIKINVAPANSLPITINLLINGSSSPSSVAYDSNLKIDWSASNADYCKTYGSYIPLTNGKLWTELTDLAPAGTAAGSAKNVMAVPTNSLQIGLQCFRGSVSAIKSVDVALHNPTSQPTVKVTSPNGGETWKANTIQTITWQGDMWFNNVKAQTYEVKLIPYNQPCQDQACPQFPVVMQYTLASNVYGNSFNWIAGKVLMNGSYQFVTDGQYTIQVCQIETGICDTSDSYFKIISELQPTINFLYPLNGENIKTGSTQVIKWDINNVPTGDYSYAIGLYLGNQFITYVNLTNKTYNSANWTVDTNLTAANNYRLYFTGNYGGPITTTGKKVEAWSNYFSISSSTQPLITVTSPNGGEQWKVGETRTVTWEANNINKVRIYIYDDSIYGSGSTNYIVPDNSYVAANLGSYTWTIQQNQLPGGNTLPRNYKIRIDNMDNGDNVTMNDSSNNYFTITTP